MRRSIIFAALFALIGAGCEPPVYSAYLDSEDAAVDARPVQPPIQPPVDSAVPMDTAPPVVVPDAAPPVVDAGVDTQVEPPPDAGMEAAVDAAPPVAMCPFVGHYRLEKLTCRSTDVSTMFFAAVTSVTMGVTATPEGCRIDLVATSAGCTKTSVIMVSADGANYQLSTDGIASCSVPDCELYENDEACQVGEENYSKSATLTLADGALTIDRRDDTGICAFTGRGPEQSVWRSE